MAPFRLFCTIGNTPSVPTTRLCLPLPCRIAQNHHWTSAKCTAGVTIGRGAHSVFFYHEKPTPNLPRPFCPLSAFTLKHFHILPANQTKSPPYLSILTSALELPEPTKPSEAAHTTGIEDPAKAPQSLNLVEQAQTLTPIEAETKSQAAKPPSCKMFTTDKPPKYNGPINGRDRLVKKPADFVLPHEEEDAEQYEAMLQYLSIYTLEERSETPSMVYACPNAKCASRTKMIW